MGAARDLEIACKEQSGDVDALLLNVLSKLDSVFNGLRKF